MRAGQDRPAGSVAPRPGRAPPSARAARPPAPSRSRAAAWVVKRSSQRATGRPKRPSSWRAKRRARAVIACAVPSACVGRPDDEQDRTPAVRPARRSPRSACRRRFGNRRQRMRNPRCWSRRRRRRCAAFRSRRRERSPPASRARSPSPPRITRVRPRRTAGKNRCRAASSPPASAARPARRTARRDRRQR